MIFADGATYNSGNQMMFCWSPHETAFINRAMTGYNTHVSNTQWGNASHSYPTGVLHMRLAYKGTNNWDGWISPDGVTWANIYVNDPRGSSFTPTHVGIAMSSWGASRDIAVSCTYCRYNF